MENLLIGDFGATLWLSGGIYNIRKTGENSKVEIGFKFYNYKYLRNFVYECDEPHRTANTGGFPIAPAIGLVLARKLKSSQYEILKRRGRDADLPEVGVLLDATETQRFRRSVGRQGQQGRRPPWEGDALPRSW